MTAPPLTVREPPGTPTKGVIVVQEAFGVNDHIADVAARFADEGYLAVAPHLFHRSGDPTLAYDDIGAAREVMADLTAEGILDDVDDAVGHLGERGVAAASIGIVGFCMGGSVALAVAARRRLGAAVTFYGGGLATGRFGFPPLVDEARQLQTPWLGLFGDLDSAIPIEEVEAVREAAAAADQPTEVVRYPDAEHGFHCDARASYHAASAKDAWSRTLAWFDEFLSSPVE